MQGKRGGNYGNYEGILGKSLDDVKPPLMRVTNHCIQSIKRGIPESVTNPASSYYSEFPQYEFDEGKFDLFFCFNFMNF